MAASRYVSVVAPIDLARAPEFKIVNRAAWDMWCDYHRGEDGESVMCLAVVWGRLMQGRIDAGYSLDNIAEDTLLKADPDGVFSSRFGKAVYVLRGSWVFGRSLYDWAGPRIMTSSERRRYLERAG